MAKKPKQKQTEWNIQGKQIADTAAPYYQNNLTRMENYLSDPSAAIDKYIDKYYTNTSAQNAFLRNYDRATSNATAYNYNATGGGYDSSNQRLYDDQQRYQNDLASKLYDYGVQSGAAMAYQDYSNLLQGNQAYQNAYALGKNYSDTDQYNYMVGQTNKWYNQLGGLLGGVGAAVGNAIAPGVGGYVGGAIGGALGDATTMTFPGEQNTGNTWANMLTTGLGNYYGQNYINNQRSAGAGSNSSIREGASDNNTTSGQYVNPYQQTTSNLFKSALDKYNIPSKFSWQN